MIDEDPRHIITRHRREGWFARHFPLVVRAVIVAALVNLTVTLFAVGCTNQDSRSVPCPTEDDCTVDYHQGAWHVGVPGSTPQ